MAALDAASELARVEAWRLHELLEGGYPVALAERIAGQTSIDLHQALELLKRGCPPETAARILL